MGVAKVPPGDAPESERVVPEKVWYSLWYVPAFPLSMLGGKLDKNPHGAQSWIMGLLDAIRREGRLLNPVIVWNHHPMRGGKQPKWLLRAGSNRVWCAEQLGWTHVPAVVSTTDPWTQAPPEWFGEHRRLAPEDVQPLFADGGHIWANEHGFGLLRAKKPEHTYADYRPTEAELAQIRPTDHGRKRMVNPMTEPQA